MKLFDEVPRSDDSPIQPDEDTFAFLNRVDDIYFGRVRDLVEEWFSVVPAADQPTLRGRLRSRSEANSAPAFWELFLREALRRSGFILTHEPKLDHRRRPDFLAVGADSSFYLEARFVGARDDSRARNAQIERIKYEVNKVASDDYLLYFDVRAYGTNVPSLQGLRGEMAEWLAGLSYDDVVAAVRVNAPLSERTFHCNGWVFWFRAVPKREHARGFKPRAGIIAMGPITRGGGSESERLNAVLEKKAGYYGDLDRPFVVALCCGDVFVDYEDIVSALYGHPAYTLGEDDSATPFRKPTGLFSGRGHPRVSAILTVRDFRVWLVHKIVPVIWRNQNALYPLGSELPWTASGQLKPDGTISIDDPQLSLATLLDLPMDWPGPEKALRVRPSAGPMESEVARAKRLPRLAG